jgi:ABC-2 type transport system permease protein
MSTMTAPADIGRATRAEMLRLRKWPAVWITLGTWLALSLMFGYLFNYLSYATGDNSFSNEGATKATLLAEMMPANAPNVFLQGMPMFGGALMLVLGAIVAGNGYGWGTWKTVFTTGPRRGAVLGGTFAALGAILVGLVLATLAVDLIASTIIALAEGQAIVAPTLVSLVQDTGGALLIAGMWAAAGALLGALTRGPALAVGLGLVWSLVVENLLRGVASLLGPLQTVTDLLPGTVAGSVAAAVGALPASDPNGTPGVNTIWDGPTAIVLAVGYLLAFALGTIALMRRRDLTG